MAGIDAFGTQFNRNNGVGVWQTIGSVTDINGPSRSKEALEVTAHDSPDKYREFVSGLKDGGEVTLTINYDPANATHQALDDDFEADELHEYQLVILPGEPDEFTWQYDAVLTDLGDAFPHDDKMERDATFKISGKPVLTATGGP